MSKQKLSDLAKKKGIYAVLLVGVFVVVAVVMVMVTGKTGDSNDGNLVDLNEPQNAAQNVPGSDDGTYADGNQQGDGVNVADTTNPTVEPKVQDVTQKPEVTPVAEATPKAEEKPENTNDVAEKPEEPKTKPVVQAKPENLTFEKADGLQWPLKGDIIMPYSVDKTAYFATLKQYMTNPAILISGECGAEVKAAAKGIVTAVEEDPRIGNKITMNIGNDFSLVYGQLEKTNLKVGDVVKAGAVIGHLNTVTRFFVIEGPHLYFQVLEGENSIDPMTLLKD